MVDETTFGREPIQIVELEQPRCALRYGIGLCTASGGPSCHNTWTTCQDRSNIDVTGSIKWRFIKAQSGAFPIGDFTDPDNIETNAIPCLSSVSTQKGSMNIGGILEGKSPFGVRSAVSVSLNDFPWDEHVGDFYLTDRTTIQGNFWAKWIARNKLYAGMYLRIYDGYRGQALADMRQRVYVLDSVSGPNADGGVTLSGTDPLRFADKNKAEFPRKMDVKLVGDISASATAVRMLGTLADLTDAFGNTAEHYIRIGDEILCYTGVTLFADGIYDLNGVTRGVIGTAADTHSDTDGCQRAGRFVAMPIWSIAHDLLTNHTSLPASFIDTTQWDEEGETYLSTFYVTATVEEPVSVETLCGELCQQGVFSIWWDEWAQTIPLLVVRPPKIIPPLLDDDSNILAGSSQLDRDPDARLTRVFVYYGRENPTDSLTDINSFQTLSGLVEGEIELPVAGDGVRVRTIYSRWINTESQAVQIISRLLMRYRDVPRFLTIRLDAKDRAITVGEVCDVTTRSIVDQDGVTLQTRWQVISVDEMKHGEIYVLDLQTYEYIGRFAVWMADGSPDYLAATDEEKLNGAWWADDDGLMSDGSIGYQWQ